MSRSGHVRLLGRLAAAALIAPASQPAPAASGAERALACDPQRPAGCEVACVAPRGEPLFVYDRVIGARFTDFASGHTLLVLERAWPDEVLSLPLGAIGHCALTGLARESVLGKDAPRDPPADPPAAAAPAPAPTDPAPGGASAGAAPAPQGESGGGRFGALGLAGLALALLAYRPGLRRRRASCSPPAPTLSRRQT